MLLARILRPSSNGISLLLVGPVNLILSYDEIILSVWFYARLCYTSAIIPGSLIQMKFDMERSFSCPTLLDVYLAEGERNTYSSIQVRFLILLSLFDFGTL